MTRTGAQAIPLARRADRHQTMAAGEFEFGFAVNWMRKDLDITLQTGRALAAQLPLTALGDQFYALRGGAVTLQGTKGEVARSDLLAMVSV